MKTISLFKPRVTPKPSCKNCVFYLYNKNLDSKAGFCTLFSYEVTDKMDILLTVEELRKNTGICGPDAKYFEHIEKD
jgi:hypothetical protein